MGHKPHDHDIHDRIDKATGGVEPTMTLYDYAVKIEEAFLRLPKKGQAVIRASYGPEFQIVCLVGLGWFNRNALTDLGREKLHALGAELSVEGSINIY